ncbi:MAG TPA: AMP-binding protein, partial [Gemmatimonadaceae bacterium]|nr:AMP-binding protein [Gemmatimonadaceae bacterium]
MPGSGVASEALLAPSVGHLVRQAASRFGTRDLFRFGDRRLSFEGVEARTNQLAHVLRAYGVRRGDRVALMLPNGVDFPLAWLAIAKPGAVMVPLNVQYRAHDLAYTVGDSGASLVLADSALVPLVREAAPALPALRDVVEVAPGAADGAGPSAFAARVREASPTFDFEAVGPGDLLNIQYTSG